MSHVFAMLGPTNTGKTHRAVQRMLEYETGMLGLPLRLLARELYDRVSAQVGEAAVALVTGEEKRVPRAPRYWICTVEGMPVSRSVEFLAIDEIQLAAHPQRGHVFTDRILHARGTHETWLLGAESMRAALRKMVPALNVEPHARLSQLSFAGNCTLSRLPPRSALVAFSVEEVYALAERLRIAKGGAAVVLGALSPRTRNAQVAMFQAGEVDYMVATDAIGMGLNLDVHHVRFTSLSKFDGREVRSLELGELGQIAGRAGRYMQDGTFGTLAPEELPQWAADAIAQHRFPPIDRVRWRAHTLDFSSLKALDGSLSQAPPSALYTPNERTEDVEAFRALAARPRVRALAADAQSVQLLWDVACIPDFRKLLLEAHVSQLEDIFFELHERSGRLRSSWLEPRVQAIEDGPTDVETLTFRIASLRTWAYAAHKSRWLEEGAGAWRARIGALEDRLSDALHQALLARFVARKRKQPMRRPDKHHPFAALAKLEVVSRAEVDPLTELADAPHATFILDSDGTIHANGRPIARLIRGKSLLLPDVRLLDADLKPGLARQLERRLFAFARDLVRDLLRPIAPLHEADSAAVRALAHALDEGLGTVPLNKAPRLTERDRDILTRHAVRLSRASIEVTALQSSEARRLRAALLSVA